MHSTTRSPAETPAARKCRAQDAAMRPNAPQVSDSQRAPRHARSIGRSGHRRLRPNIIEARFGQVRSLCTHPPNPQQVIPVAPLRPGL